MYTSMKEHEAMLYTKPRFRHKSTLHKIKSNYNMLVHYLSEVGLQEPSYVQVLGTNGKGSTSSYFSSISQEHGYITGAFLSPHIYNIRERIIINGQRCSEELWLHSCNVIEEICCTEELLFFEYIFLMSIYIFCYCKVDIAIIEAGLGGRYDSTSILNYQVQCVTSISYDHQEVLGDTISAITEEKAGALQKESLIFSTQQSKEVETILLKNVAQGIQFIHTEPIYDLSLLGQYQHGNANLAVAGWRGLASILNIQSVEEKIRKGCQKTYITGRLESINITPSLELLLDGGHNYQGLTALSQYCQNKNILCVYYSTVYRRGLKDIVKKVAEISQQGALYYISMSNERGVPYKEIIQYGVQFIECHSLRSSIEEYKNKGSSGTIVICGSLYFLGYFFQDFPEYYKVK